jgi:hypothetical protein
MGLCVANPRGIQIKHPQTRGEERRLTATVRDDGGYRQEGQVTVALNER